MNCCSSLIFFMFVENFSYGMHSSTCWERSWICVLFFFFKLKLKFYLIYFFILLFVDEYTYVKSYSSTSLVFVNTFNFGLLALRSISLLLIFSHPFISFFWYILIFMMVNYPTHHHHSHLKYWNYIQIVFLFFQHHF